MLPVEIMTVTWYPTRPFGCEKTPSNIKVLLGPRSVLVLRNLEILSTPALTTWTRKNELSMQSVLLLASDVI